MENIIIGLVVTFLVCIFALILVYRQDKKIKERKRKDTTYRIRKGF